MLSSGSDHYQLDPSVFEALPCQTIPRHLFDLVPVLTEIAGSLILGEKFGLHCTPGTYFRLRSRKALSAALVQAWALPATHCAWIVPL
jgi:hypothetical protein